MKRYGIGAAALAAAVAGSAQAGDAVQWAEADGGNGHWYENRILDVVCREEGAEIAESVGGYLASCTSAEENAFVDALIPDTGSYSAATIGGFQPSGSGEPGEGWLWLSGEPWSFTAWRAGQPNNAQGEEDWIVMYSLQYSGWPGWHDAGVDDHCADGVAVAGPYIIEWSADCNGDGIVDYGQILDGTYEDTDGNGVPDCCDAGEPCDGPSPITVDDDLADFPNADFTSIQDAIDAASDGDTILVYPGTYTGGGAYVASLGDKQVSILSVGGAAVTLVDGESAHGGLYLDGSQGLDTVIQGFTFANCGVEGQHAIELWRASGPTLADCVIRDCAGHVLHSGPQHLGDPVGNPHILRCEFRDNTPAVHGGAVLYFNYNSPVMEDCIFEANEARYLHFSYLGNNLPTYINCVFDRNTVGNEGLLHARSSSKVTLVGCYFSENLMASDCVLAGSGSGGNGWFEVSDTHFCGNDPGNGICTDWSDLGGNTFEDECGPGCVADIFEDGAVTVEDLLIVLAQYGTAGPEADIDGSGEVDVEDLLIVVGSWGECP